MVPQLDIYQRLTNTADVSATIKHTANVAERSTTCMHQDVVNHSAACFPANEAVIALHETLLAKMRTGNCHSVAA